MSAVLEWDSEDWRRLRNEKLLGWMRGNAQAVDTVIALSTIAETWDDLHDGDNQPSKDRINKAFTLALVKLQVNEFYKANEALFYALTVTAINAWMDANELQNSENVNERMMAFGLRNLGHEITMLAVFRATNWEQLRSVSLEIRRFFVHETYYSWEHRHA
jgi:hypothetical protein